MKKFLKINLPINPNSNEIFFKHENLNLAFSAAKSIRYNVINIFHETFMEEKQIMILGILWQIIKNVVRIN